MTLIHYDIPMHSGDTLNSQTLNLEAGDVLFLVGRNGAGKSALLYRLAKVLEGESLVHMSALRQNTFSARQSQLNEQSFVSVRRQVRKNAQSGEGRTTDNLQDRWSDMILHQLKRFDDIRSRKISGLVDEGRAEDAITISRQTAPSLDVLNSTLADAGIGIGIEYDEPTFAFKAAHQSGNRTGLHQLSDGERAAIQVATVIITADEGSVFCIDEPERHMHRSMSAPLLNALVTSRSDCAFVVSTHDVDLVYSVQEAKVGLVRDCKWRGNEPASWDFQLLLPDNRIPEELRRTIIGARRNILFVEGTEESLDYQLFSLLFADTTIVPQSTCTEVIRAVKGVNASREMHDVRAFGLIDRDDRTPEEVAALEGESITTLGVRSVEALYYQKPCAGAVQVALEAATGERYDGYEVACAKAVCHLADNPTKVDELVARKAEAKMRETLLSHMPTWKDIRDKPDISHGVSVASTYAAEKQKVERLITERDFQSLVAQYPLRDTGALSLFAAAIGRPNHVAYTRAVKSRLTEDVHLASQLLPLLGKAPDWLPLRVQ